MGVILSGILGGFSGKVGPVVGGKWKDVDYMRSYVIPANPNTSGQQAVRAKFAALVVIARALLSTVLQPFWDLYYSNMSGFNAWISQNYSLADSAGVIDETAIMTKGTLTPILDCQGGYDTGDGSTSVDYTANIVGNASATDSMSAIAYHVPTGNFYFAIDADVRDGSTLQISGVPSGLTATDLIVWAFATSGTGSEMIVSDSLGDVCNAV